MNGGCIVQAQGASKGLSRGQFEADTASEWVKQRRKVNVLVHRAFWTHNGVACYFVKVVNLSKRDVEITHVWFQGPRPIPINPPQRPLPYRLKQDEPWETFIQEESLPEEVRLNAFTLARVGLSTGKNVEF